MPMYAQAKQFISSGAVESTDLSTLADECNRYIHLQTQKSLKSALTQARRFVKRARPHQGILLTAALRALGWVYLISGKYRSAADAYLEARALARRDGSMRSRIDRILVDVYMHLGDYKEAHRRARTAIATFSRLRARADVAKTRVNFANLYHRQDRHREAGKQYQQAITFFRASKDKLSLASCCYNYANTLVQLFDYDKAFRYYTEGEALFTELGYDLYANECRYGLAWMNMLQGNYHAALLGLADCEKVYRKIAQPKGIMVCQLDRAEAYLGLNLWTDARNAAEDAEKRARKLGVHYESAKAALFFAKASFAVSDRHSARKALQRALTGFRRENNKAFQGVALLTTALMSDNNKVDTALLNKARTLFSHAQLPLWEAFCDVQLAHVQPNKKIVRDRLRRNPAVKAVPHLYASWQTLLGDIDAGAGRLARARKHWTNAIERLESVRAKLPPVELRSAFLRKQSDPYQRMINPELESDTQQAAAWSERHKTAGLWGESKLRTKPDKLRHRAEESLAELAQRVMSLSLQIDSKTGKRSTQGSQSQKALDSLQKKVCLDLARLENPDRQGATHLETLIRDIDYASKKQPVVQFHYSYPDLIAFVHHRGQTRYVRYDDGCRLISQYMGCWQIQLNRVLAANNGWHKEDLEEESSLFRNMGDWLWSPLEIPSEQKRVLVIPEGKMSNLPWKALVVNGSPLVNSQMVGLSPSLRHFRHAGGIRVHSDAVEVFIGDVKGLRYSKEEKSIFSQGVGAKVTVHDPCLRSSIPSRRAARIWHYSGHAELRSDNPFYSSLTMADGPLFAADLRLRDNKVGLVVLAACRTGQQTFVLGEESTGLVRSLLEMGARNVVASHWAISDKSTALWAREFYKSLFTGDAVDEALRRSALAVRERYPSAYFWAGFSLFGAF